MSRLAPSRSSLDLSRIRVSHSQLELAHQCMRKWAYKYILDLPDEQEDTALVYGSALHEALEAMTKGASWEQFYGAGLAVLNASPTFRQPDKKIWYDSYYHHLVGYLTHFWPSFFTEWEVVGQEIPIEYEISPGIGIKGFIDLVCRNRKTGGIGIFDYKASSDSYISSLSSILDYSHQLALYVLAYHRQVQPGTWPDTAGYIFLKKAKRNAKPEVLSQDASYYLTKTLTIGPSFRAFCLSTEMNDVALSQILQQYRLMYGSMGTQAIDAVPARFSECRSFGQLCTYAKGCHSGEPLHRRMKEQTS